MISSLILRYYKALFAAKYRAIYCYSSNIAVQDNMIRYIKQEEHINLSF